MVKKLITKLKCEKGGCAILEYILLGFVSIIVAGGILIFFFL